MWQNVTCSQIVIFATIRENHKVLTNSRNIDVAIRHSKTCIFNLVPGYNANLLINVAHVRYDPHTTAGWRLIILPLWHSSLRHPAGNTPPPVGEPCMYTYICDFFVCFGSYLFVRALLAKTLSKSTQEGRPQPLVEVWAQSELCSSRGVLSKFFFRREWIRRFPVFSVWCLFFTYVPVKCMIFFCHL